MKKLTLVILSLVLLSCCLPKNEDKKETSTSEKIITDTVKKVEKKVKKFKITEESLIGNWYSLVTQNKNPEYYNKILIGADYIAFYPDGVIKEVSVYPDRIDERFGNYSIDTSTNEVTIRYTVKNDVLQHKWRQLSSGKALEFHWININLDFEKNLNNYYIKRGSKDWDNYGKKRIDMDKIRDIVNSIDALELKKGYKYKISKKTPLMSSYSYDGSLNPFYLSKGNIIEILSKTEVDGTIWYKVNIAGSDKSGWINSVALFGQNIQKVSN